MEMHRDTTTHDGEEQLVVFTLGAEYYGVNIEAVKTIIRFPDITQVPHTPPYIRGVINLRGVIVPVIDLRARFGMPPAEVTKATRVVVVESNHLLVGMVVDVVTETLRLTNVNIEPLSELVLSADSRYLRAVGKCGDRLIVLLALDKVLERNETDALHAMAQQAASDNLALAG